MIKSLSSRYADVIEKSFVPESAWRWPQPRDSAEAAPDQRLLGKNITGMRAELTLQTGATVTAQVRALSQHDIVLNIMDPASVPVMGQVAEVTLRWESLEVVTSVRAILHWSGNIYGQAIVGLFTIEPMGENVEQWQKDECRGELRFPSNLPATVEVSSERDVIGCIVDYSLSGCRFIAAENFDLDVDYAMTVLLPQSSVEVTLRPRWVQAGDAGFQMGCTFEPDQGVLLACRHHPQPHGITTPFNPQTTNWVGVKSADEWR